MEDRSRATAPAEETLLQQITRTYYELLPAFEQHMGMTRARWHLLKQLFFNDPLSQSALQRRAGVDGAAVTRQMKQLEQAGLVARRADPYDNRFTLVALTPEGRQLVAKLLERRALFEAGAMAGIAPEEILTTQRCLSRIRANLAALVQEMLIQHPNAPEQALPGEPAHENRE